jgi:tetratricopeptide (TPR) repeat protein
MNRLTAFCLLFISAFFLAAQDQIILKDRLVTINCKGISFIGSGITVDDAKMFAVNDAKRNALEQVGTYLESSMEMKDYMITKDEIQTYTAGILKAEVLSSENKVVEGTFAIEVLIKAEIDTEYLKNRLTSIQNDAPLKKMLEEQKRLNDKLTKEINELKEQKTGYIEKSKDIAKSLAAADWFDIGFKAQESGYYQEALKNYGKALELDPKNSLIYNNRGLIYYFMKDFPKAESNFDKAIELNPKLYMAFNNKAIIYYERRLYEQAIRYFDMVIMLDPAVEQPYYNRAFAYFKLGKTEPCLSDLRTYLKMAGNKYGDEQRIINFIKENEKQPEKTPEPVPEPEMMTVPDLYNTTPEAAKKRITESGLELGIIKSVTDEDKGFDRVIGQSLKKGLKVKKGSVIDITVNEEAADGW